MAVSHDVVRIPERPARAIAGGRRPLITLVRHGRTRWSAEGRYAGLRDIALSAQGRSDAAQIGLHLRVGRYARVFSSPLTRAMTTCALSGFGSAAHLLTDLAEWDCGTYEGLRSSEIRAQRPEWTLFADGCPSGERPEDVLVRADRVIKLLRAGDGDALIFSHGHFLRALAVRWIGLPLAVAEGLVLDSGSVSSLSTLPGGRPVITRWNDTAHLRMPEASRRAVRR